MPEKALKVDNGRASSGVGPRPILCRQVVMAMVVQWPEAGQRLAGVSPMTNPSESGSRVKILQNVEEIPRKIGGC